MNKFQKIALFNLCLAATCLLIQFLSLLIGDPPIKLAGLITTLILCLPLIPSYFYRLKLAKQGGNKYDERDKSIHTTAALYGLMAAFIVFFLATFLAFLIVGPGGEINIGLMLGIFIIGAMSFFTTESANVLVRYGGISKGEES